MKISSFVFVLSYSLASISISLCKIKQRQLSFILCGIIILSFLLVSLKSPAGSSNSPKQSISECQRKKKNFFLPSPRRHNSRHVDVPQTMYHTKSSQSHQLFDVYLALAKIINHKHNTILVYAFIFVRFESSAEA